MSVDVSIAVVGLGLVGAAAVRHGSASGASASGDVIGIGPAEPADWAAHGGAFASHYDSGRVTRRLDARREWAILASRAIEQYPVIERAAGVRFHEPAGMVYVRNDPDGIARQRSVAAELGIPIVDGPAPAPYRFPRGWTCLAEPGPAGHIDPRKMIDAQLIAAAANGGTIVREEVAEVEAHPGGHRVRTASGVEVTARSVIIATGSYGNHLTPRPLAVSIRSEAIILCEVSEETAAALTMPSAIWLIDHPELLDVYVVPPVLYPDGRWYLKVGAAWEPAPRLDDDTSRLDWMTGNRADDRLGMMRSVVDEMLPDIDFLSFSMKPCLITDTATGLPFVGMIDNGLVVARGGNGHAAKSADAIGALAVGLATHGEWTDPLLDEADFRPQFTAGR